MSLLANHGLIDSLDFGVQFVDAGAADAVGVGATSINLPYAANMNGNIMIVHIAINDLTTTPTTPTGFTPMFADTDGSFVKMYTYFKYITGAESGSLPITLSSVNGVVIGRLYVFKNVRNPPPINESGGLAIVSYTYSPSSITSTVSRSLAVSFAYLPNSDPGTAGYTTGAYTGNTGGTWVERASAKTSVHNGAIITMQTAALPIVGTISGGSYATDVGGLALTRSFSLKAQ